MANNIIDYNDERLTTVEKEGTARKNEVTENYNKMINDRDTYTQQQQANLENWQKQQTELQQAQTAHTIDKINQQKDQNVKDYQKEQKASYTDYMKQSNQYGANAEMLARQGLQNSGYQESSQVSMWNTYQNRVASARESYKKAVLEYDNMIKDAELSNNEALANIAQQKLEQSLQIALQGFEYKNNLTIQRDNKIDDIDTTYHAKYQDVLNQINREYEYEQQQKQWQEQQRQWQAEYDAAERARQKEYEQWQAEYDASERARQKEYEQWQQEYALKKAETQATIAKIKAQNAQINGYNLTNSGENGVNSITKNAKAVYNAYLLAKKVPLAGKKVTLENFLKTQLSAGKISPDEMKQIIYTYE